MKNLFKKGYEADKNGYLLMIDFDNEKRNIEITLNRFNYSDLKFHGVLCDIYVHVNKQIVNRKIIANNTYNNIFQTLNKKEEDKYKNEYKILAKTIYKDILQITELDELNK